MTMPHSPVLTVGHSNHRMDHFLSLLERHSVSAVADVRSTPYSRFSSQYNKDSLKRCLAKHDIQYVFLGRELGARSDNTECYKDGRVQYPLLAGKESFRTGIERVLTGAKKERIALMCTERDPLDCHRTILVARTLTERGLPVDHILPSGQAESHEQAMLRLLDKVNLPRAELLRTTEELIEIALARQEQRIAYVDPALSELAQG